MNQFNVRLKCYVHIDLFDNPSAVCYPLNILLFLATQISTEIPVLHDLEYCRASCSSNDTAGTRSVMHGNAAVPDGLLFLHLSLNPEASSQSQKQICHEFCKLF